MNITPKQIRAARAMLGISQVELGRRAGVSCPRISQIELGSDALQSTMNAIHTALLRSGVEFCDGGVQPASTKEAPFIAGPGNPDAETIRAAKAILTAAAAMRKPVGGLG
jgi:transcriptional regulator with XRE-family HTH domain